MSYFCCFTLVLWQLWLYGDYPTGCRLPVGLTKLLEVTQLICGPNEAPGRNQVVRSFTCGPNETPSRSLVTWPWVFVVLCFWKVLENYMAHMVYYVVWLFFQILVLHYSFKSFRLLQGRWFWENLCKSFQIYFMFRNML